MEVATERETITVSGLEQYRPLLEAARDHPDATATALSEVVSVAVHWYLSADRDSGE